MIDLKDKGLFATTLSNVAAAGHRVRFEDGVWITSDDTAVQLIIDAFTLDEAKAEITAKVNAWAKSIRDSIVANFSPGEMAAWSVKFAEAAAYTANPTASTPILSLEATHRGVPLTTLVALVMTNATLLGKAESQIAGTQGKHKDSIKTLTTFNAVAAYDFSTGWPA